MRHSQTKAITSAQPNPELSKHRYAMMCIDALGVRVWQLSRMFYIVPVSRFLIARESWPRTMYKNSHRVIGRQGGAKLLLPSSQSTSIKPTWANSTWKFHLVRDAMPLMPRSLQGSNLARPGPGWTFHVTPCVSYGCPRGPPILNTPPMWACIGPGTEPRGSECLGGQPLFELH